MATATNHGLGARRWWRGGALAAVLVSGCALPATYHYDLMRTGWNSLEGTLTPANVTPSTFGLIASATLDDQVDTEPLVITSQAIDGLNHTVVYVATEGNTVYAIDGISGAILKSVNLGTPVHTPLGCGNNGPNVGIDGTPTIDVQNQILYVIAYVQSGTGPQYQLHALDTGTLADKPGSPVTVAASHTLSDGTTYTFNASVQRQRPGLLQANGNLYAAFGSFCDFSPNQSRGWVLGWNTTTLAPLPANELTDTLATAPSSYFLSAIWMSGYGPAADDSGNLYFVTGNGNSSTYNGTTSIQESVVKVKPDLSGVVDLFTPSNTASLDSADNDYGSGGVMLLPDQPGSLPHLAVAAGKDGRLFILNRDNMGGFATPDRPPHISIGGCWCGPSYFQGADGVGRVVTSGGSQVKTWRVNAAIPPSLTLEGTSPSIEATGQDPGFFTAISSSVEHANTQIIWAVGRPSGTDNHVTLYAFNGTASGATLNQLWSSVAGSWPNTGGNSNIVPSVGNGKVYVASYKRLAIFGPISTLRPLPPRLIRWQDLIVPPDPGPKVEGAVFWGTVKEVKETTVVIALRDGKTMNVDIAEAQKLGTCVVPTVGSHLVVNGTVVDGVLKARLVNRAKGPATWGADAPQ